MFGGQHPDLQSGQGFETGGGQAGKLLCIEAYQLPRGQRLYLLRAQTRDHISLEAVELCNAQAGNVFGVKKIEVGGGECAQLQGAQSLHLRCRQKRTFVTVNEQAVREVAAVKCADLPTGQDQHVPRFHCPDLCTAHGCNLSCRQQTNI